MRAATLLRRATSRDTFSSPRRAYAHGGDFLLSEQQRSSGLGQALAAGRILDSLDNNLRRYVGVDLSPRRAVHDQV